MGMMWSRASTHPAQAHVIAALLQVQTLQQLLYSLQNTWKCIFYISAVAYNQIGDNPSSKLRSWGSCLLSKNHSRGFQTFNCWIIRYLCRPISVLCDAASINKQLNKTKTNQSWAALQSPSVLLMLSFSVISLSPFLSLLSQSRTGLENAIWKAPSRLQWTRGWQPAALKRHCSSLFPQKPISETLAQGKSASRTFSPALSC